MPQSVPRGTLSIMSGQPGRAPGERRTPRAVLIAALVAALAGTALAGTGMLFTTAQPAPVAPVSPLLIKHGWDVPNPEFVRSHVKALEALPFDGLTISTHLSHKVQSRTPVSYAQFRAALAPVKATKFKTLRHNFLMVYATPSGDVFANWSVPVNNFRNLARAARDAGFVGVFYDNEEYFGDALQYPRNCAQRKLTECQAQARLRGQQVMNAMRSQWPTVQVLAAHGPWVSDPRTPKHLPGVAYNDVSFANLLTGSFLVGLVQGAAGTSARVIDGGEIYTARTAKQFAAIKALQTRVFPAKSTLVPKSLRSRWGATVSAGFGVYDRRSGGSPMTAATWRTTLTNALAATDQYVWAYTERYNWTGHDSAANVPRDWIAATRAARAAQR